VLLNTFLSISLMIAFPLGWYMVDSFVAWNVDRFLRAPFYGGCLHPSGIPGANTLCNPTLCLSPQLNELNKHGGLKAAAEESSLIEHVHACNRVCAKAAVEEWGGKVAWHRHVGKACRPAKCTPK